MGEKNPIIISSISIQFSKVHILWIYIIPDAVYVYAHEYFREKRRCYVRLLENECSSNLEFGAVANTNLRVANWWVQFMWCVCVCMCDIVVLCAMELHHHECVLRFFLLYVHKARRIVIIVIYVTTHKRSTMLSGIPKQLHILATLYAKSIHTSSKN